MKLETLRDERIEDFINYCKKHRKEIDESYLCDEDLKEFKPDDENPTYIITNEEDKIVATASLVIDEYYKRGKKGRFRILHSEIEDIKYYNLLMEAILKHTKSLDNVFIFIPVENKRLIEFFKKLNYKVERYSYFLVREDLEVPSYTLPENYKIRAFRRGQDEEDWCNVRNIAFANLKGSETPITSKIVSMMISSSDYIEGGLMILYHNDKAVGVVRGSEDEYENSLAMNIGPLAILPEYQSRGLGRNLLRASLEFAKTKGYKMTTLCVNAENEGAKALYIQEGFKEVESVVCYKYDL